MKKNGKKAIKDFKKSQNQLLSKVQKSKIKGGIVSEDLIIV